MFSCGLDPTAMLMGCKFPFPLILNPAPKLFIVMQIYIITPCINYLSVNTHRLGMQLLFRATTQDTLDKEPLSTISSTSTSAVFSRG